MQKKFENEVITPQRVIDAIETLLEYTELDNMIIRAWLENDNYAEVLREIDQKLKLAEVRCGVISSVII